MKKTKLTKAEIKRGIYINPSLGLEEVARRKVKSDAFKKVQYGRKGIIVTEYGKRLAVILPLADTGF